MMKHQYETVIGLEVHVELATKTKIFCGCSTSFGAAHNENTCPVCTGMPGTLPVLNKKVVEHAIAVGLATNCTISKQCRFDRKNYFYPDNPQNYQISQLYEPICRDGFVQIMTETGQKTIRIREIHMEEDAGKLCHDETIGFSMVDFNRAGVPLIEIVSEPDMRTAEEVIAYLEELRTRIQYLEASDCRIEEGSMRVDVNLSVRKIGEEKLGTRTEMKNLSSFRSITRAVKSETKRQIDLLNSGQCVIQETRRWDENKEESFTMRSKEDAKDYRYFPDPDLPDVFISEEWIQTIRSQQPEFRSEKMERYKQNYDLPVYDIEILTESKKMAELFEQTVEICKQPKKVSNWLMGETLRLSNEQGKKMDEIHFSPEHLASLIDLVDRKVISGTVAKEVFELIFRMDIDPVSYVEENQLGAIRDEQVLEELIRDVIKANPKSVEDYRNGKQKAIGFLVGQTMKETKGKADPQKVRQILLELV